MTTPMTARRFTMRHVGNSWVVFKASDIDGSAKMAETGASGPHMGAEEWDARYAAGRQWSVGPNAILSAQLEDRPLPPGRALDIGCGEGRNAIWLASLGWEVDAIDLSAVGLDRAREAASAAGVSVHWTEGDALAGPDLLADRRDGGWDLVVVAYLQLPADQRRRLLEVVRWALAPGGTFLAVAHDLRNLRDGWGGPKDPEVLWSPKEAAAEFAPSRYAIDAAAVVERPVVVDGVEHVALDTLVRIRSIAPPAG